MLFFFFVNRIIFYPFYFYCTEKKITRKVSKGTFREYILTRFRKSQKENHSDPKKYQGLVLLVFLIFVSKISQILCILY